MRESYNLIRGKLSPRVLITDRINDEDSRPSKSRPGSYSKAETLQFHLRGHAWRNERASISRPHLSGGIYVNAGAGVTRKRVTSWRERERERMDTSQIDMQIMPETRVNAGKRSVLSSWPCGDAKDPVICLLPTIYIRIVSLANDIIECYSRLYRKFHVH